MPRYRLRISLRSAALLALALLSVCQVAEMCLTHNCAPGGKRQGKGPCSCAGDSGVCVGDSVCCGSFGCSFGAGRGAGECRGVSGRRAAACRRLMAGAAPCNGAAGVCAAPGICCDVHSCRRDVGCDDASSRRQLLQELLA